MFEESNFEDDVVFAGDHFPVGLWLGPTACLVFTGKSPEPAVVDNLTAELTAQGMAPIEVAEDLEAAIMSLTMARVAEISGLWKVWAADEPTARAAIIAAAIG